MKKVLFATTATAALAIGGMASAQGMALFGDARMGLGYNINNDGGIRRRATTTARSTRPTICGRSPASGSAST